jgi:DNA topoisomerase-1
MEKHLEDLVNYQFTAEMEDELDAISRGEMSHLKYLKEFYYGNEHAGLKQLLEKKIDEIDAREISRVRIGVADDGEEVNVRVGRYGPFVEHGEQRASIPENMPPDELKLDKALELLEKAAVGDEPLGTCPETGKPVYLKTGRFGPYVQRGSSEDEGKPQNASLLKGIEPEDVDLELALKLLSLPRNLGSHPEKTEDILVHNGRYGPYVKCGEETRSLPAEISPLDVTFEQAVELLAQPKGRRRAGQRREPIKVFDTSPVTGNPVQLLDGRYGPYVTDGETNASLPRGTTPDSVTLEMALQLLKDRAERGPSRRSTRKKAAKKKTAKKTTKKAKTKAATRTVTKKKASRKTAKKKQ